MTLVPIRLLAKHQVYNAGEVAGFPAEAAKALVARGLAEYLERSGPQPQVAGEPPRVTKPARRTVRKKG